MEKELSITEARENISGIVEQVLHQGDTYVILRHGKPAAAVVPLDVYENWKRQRIEFFRTIRDAQSKSGLGSDEADRLGAEAVSASRQDDLKTE